MKFTMVLFKFQSLHFFFFLFFFCLLCFSFSYLWMNMADLKAHRTKDEFKAKIPLTFPSQGNGSVEAGDYTMTVVASEVSNPSKILAFQTKKFVLTSKPPVFCLTKN